MSPVAHKSLVVGIVGVCWVLQELRKDGFDLCENRFIELRPVLDEVRIQGEEWGFYGL